METLLLPFSPRFIVLTICAVVTALLLSIGIVDHKAFDIVLIPIIIFGALTLLGIRDLIVVTTPDAVLVVPRERAEEVKRLVSLLKQAGRSEATNHRRCHRPWGYYDAVDVGERFQVKRLVVAPGGTLSLQKHLHRSEHWVVVHGTAEVTIGEMKKIMHENESAYIPMGAVHRLSNPGKIALELIEVQTGSYFGEDDIIRLDDVYRRGPAE